MYARPKGGRGGLFPLRTVLQSYSKGFLSIKALQKGKGVFGIVNPPAKQRYIHLNYFGVTRAEQEKHLSKKALLSAVQERKKSPQYSDRSGASLGLLFSKIEQRRLSNLSYCLPAL